MARCFDADPIVGTIALGITTLLGLGNIFKKFGLASSIDHGLATAVGNFKFPTLSGLIAGVLAAEIGFQFGKKIGKELFPDDAEWYDNFSLSSFFDALSYDFEHGMEGFKLMVGDFIQWLKDSKKEIIEIALGMTGVQKGNRLVDFARKASDFKGEDLEYRDTLWAKTTMTMPKDLFDEKYQDLYLPENSLADAMEKFDNKDVTDAINENGNETNRLLSQMLAAQQSYATPNRDEVFDWVRERASMYERRTGKPALIKFYKALT